MKHRAAIIGCGRMGVGGPGWTFPYVYTHADAYLALKDRVELVALVDSDVEKATSARERWGVDTYTSTGTMLSKVKPDIVSICTPNGTHSDVFSEICRASAEVNPGLRGLWIEKPLELMFKPSIPVQVNYCRRFCEVHRGVWNALDHVITKRLYVWARKDWTTAVHFADLARWFRIPPERIHYDDNSGEYPSTNSYRIEAGKWGVDFRNGGCKGGFMETALTELLDVVDGKSGATLSSPAESAIESERLARQLLPVLKEA